MSSPRSNTVSSELSMVSAVPSKVRPTLGSLESSRRTQYGTRCAKAGLRTRLGSFPAPSSWEFGPLTLWQSWCDPHPNPTPTPKWRARLQSLQAELLWSRLGGQTCSFLQDSLSLGCSLVIHPRLLPSHLRILHFPCSLLPGHCLRETGPTRWKFMPHRVFA